MKYKNITKLEKKYISNSVKSKTSNEEVFDSIISAIYYYDTTFAGKIFLEGLGSAKGELRLLLLRLVPTFLQMHKTAFNACLFEYEIINSFNDLKNHKEELSNILAEVVELKEMFKDR